MMRFLVPCLAVAMSVCFAASSQAMLVFEDDFTYPDGDLVGNGGWVAHSGAGSTPVQVVSNAIQFSHGSGSREDVSVDLGFGNIVQGLVTYSFDLTVSDTGITGTDFEYFAHLSDGGTSTFIGRFDIVAPTGSGDFGLGIAHSSSTAESTTAADFSFDTPIPVSVTYDFTAAQASLTAGGETILSSVGTAPAFLSHMAFRQSNSSSDEILTVDNLTVISVVPEPSAFVFGSLVCCVLGWKNSRKRNR